MSQFDVFRFKFGNGPAEERLVVLRGEGLRLANYILAYSELILHDLEEIPRSIASLEIKESSLSIRDKAKELRNLLDALTAPHYREQLGLPALRPYDTLLDAVKETSKTLELSLAKALENGELYVHSDYPLVIWDSPKPQRKIAFELAESQYRVQLLSLVDGRQFVLEGEIRPKTLEKVAKIIQSWLLGNLSASDLTKTDSHD